MFEKVKAAAGRLSGVAHRTPVLTSRILNERTGAQIFLKCENFQRMGAFKFRGAYNAISQLTETQKAQGVITYSSGNHAQAVALVGQMLGVKTTIVMPNNAPATKLAATKGYGGIVVLYNPEESDRAALAQQLALEHGYTIVPPYDHMDVIAGQGTATLELMEDVGNLDALYVCVGGGGLISGSAIAAKGMSATCRVIGVEPEVANDAFMSFRDKKLHTIHNPPTIADGTRTPSLGTITFPLVLKYVDDIVTVTEDQIKEAVRFAFTYLKIVVEPSGALGIAGVLNNTVGGKVGVIISGGNIDAATMAMILSEG